MSPFLKKLTLIKFIGLFSVIRFYNIVLLAIAQVLCSVYFFSSDNDIDSVIFDNNIWFIIISTATSISAGYIINNFYDLDKDLINRPLKTIIEEKISTKTKMIVYIFLNFVCLIFAMFVSSKAFSSFIKVVISLNKIPFLG